MDRRAGMTGHPLSPRFRASALPATTAAANRPEFGTVTGLWQPDGSLRDIYVFDTTPRDWEILLDYVGGYPCTYCRDGEVMRLPGLARILEDAEGSHLLRIDLGGVAANCHFFTTSRIELDLDPREVADACRHDRVLGFLEGLATAVAKPLRLAPEGAGDRAWLCFEPARGGWRPGQ